MFRQHFGLKFNPFDKEISVDKLFESKDMMELESRFKHMLNSRGIFLLIGEPGSGKSTALRKLVAGLGHTLYKPFYLSLTTLTVKEFYQALACVLGEVPSSRKAEIFRQIQGSISSLYNEQRIVPVIIIDEIHMVSTAILDDLRLLFNFNMDSANPFVLILSGQSSIRNKLALNTCFPLKQRIALNYTMRGLTLEETGNYCNSRMKIAGCVSDAFTEAAIATIHTSTGGFLRSINKIVTASLMYCAQKKLSVVDEEAVYQGNLDVEF